MKLVKVVPISLVIIVVGLSAFAWANNNERVSEKNPYANEKQAKVNNDQQIYEKVSGANNKAKATLVVAPDFSLKDLSGRSVSLSQYHGKTVLLGFWTTW